MNRLLGIGECMVELAPVDGTEALWRQGYAGDVLNTLWYAAQGLAASGARLNDRVVGFYSAVGTDDFSEGMLHFISRAGIDCGLVQRIPGCMPGLYAIHLNEGERSFSYWRETSAARRMLEDPAHLRLALSGRTHIYFSGITLAILGQQAGSLLSALEAGAESGACIVFDTNIRPVLWSSREMMADMLMRAASLADWVLPSFDDEAAVFDDSSPEATAQRYLATGARGVVVKNGGDAVLLAESGRLIECPVEPVAELVDSTAAGDSFNGGFISAIMRGDTAERAVATGSRFAAEVIGHRGALVQLQKPSL